MSLLMNLVNRQEHSAEAARKPTTMEDTRHARGLLVKSGAIPLLDRAFLTASSTENTKTQVLNVLLLLSGVADDDFVIAVATPELVKVVLMMQLLMMS